MNSSVVMPRLAAILEARLMEHTTVGYLVLNTRLIQDMSISVLRAISSRLKRLPRPISAKVSLVCAVAVTIHRG